MKCDRGFSFFIFFFFEFLLKKRRRRNSCFEVSKFLGGFFESFEFVCKKYLGRGKECFKFCY